MEKLRNRDEVDLVELLLKGVNLIRTNFWPIIIFVCIGIGLGIFHYSSAKKVYKSSLVISSSILTRSYGKDLIERLNRHRREMNDEAIMSLLHVSQKTADNLADLDIESLSELDDLKETDRFIIIASVFDQSVLPELQQGLTYYFENNEYVKVRVEQTKKYYQEMLTKVESEIRDLEELKRKIVSGEFFQSAKGNVMFDPTIVNSKILDLTKERINYQNTLSLANSVHVIEGFTKFQRPSSPKLSISLLSGMLFGLFLLAIFFSIKSVRQLLKMADAAKQKA